METLGVTDLYHASYLLVHGCELSEVECIPLAGTLACRLSFRGDEIHNLSGQWYEKSAVVNLWAFRSAYNQINSYVHQAKKNYRHSQRPNAGGMK